MVKPDRKTKAGLLIVTSILVILVLGIFTYSYHMIALMVEQLCYERLSESTTGVSTSVSGVFRGNYSALDIAADQLAALDELDSVEAINILNGYSKEINAYCTNILLPDDRIVTITGTVQYSSIRFDDIAPLGKHFSARDTSQFVGGKEVVRQFVPIVRGTETVGVVYALYLCEDFGRLVPFRAYGGEANMYIIDRRDGNMIADTFRNEFENFNDRKGAVMKDGSVFDPEVVFNGGRGNLNFKGRSSNRYLFMSYAPTDFDEYSVMLGVYEDVAMRDAIRYRSFIVVIAASIMLLFTLYVLWIIRKTRRDIKKITELANTDVLTGTGSIIKFSQASDGINELIAAGTAPDFAVVECDLNDLKSVNDNYGHEAGNAYIRRCCNAISQVFPGTTLYRIGGDEFALILQGSDFESRERLFEKLRSVSTAPGGEQSFASGIADYIPGTDRLVSDVLKRADAMMYEKKQQMKSEAGTAAE